MKKLTKNLYLLTQKENNTWETYSAIIVCAESKELAVRINPCKDWAFDEEGKANSLENPYHNEWVSNVKKIKCKLIAEKVKCDIGIVLASYRS